MYARVSGNSTGENKIPNKNKKLSDTAQKGEKASNEINPLNSASSKDLNSLNVSKEDELPVNDSINYLGQENIYPGNTRIAEHEHEHENDNIINKKLLNDNSLDTSEDKIIINHAPPGYEIDDDGENIVPNPQVPVPIPENVVVQPRVNILPPLTPAAIVAIQNHF